MSGAPATFFPPPQYSQHRHGENEFPFVRVMMKPFFSSPSWLPKVDGDERNPLHGLTSHHNDMTGSMHLIRTAAQGLISGLGLAMQY